MTVQSPAQTLQTFVTEVRNYLRDFPSLNLLLNNQEETSDRQLLWIIAEVLDDWNQSTPPIGFLDINQIPRSYLLKGVVAEVLMSVAILNLRNSLRYTDGQVTVDLDKYQQLMAMRQILRQEYEAKRKAWKTSRNLEMALSSSTGVHSEYFYVSCGCFSTYTD
jgi:hypothetical protein